MKVSFEVKKGGLPIKWGEWPKKMGFLSLFGPFHWYLSLNRESGEAGMKRNEYDLIIIGGGITGLSTGITWAKTHPGSSLLLLEKQPIVGGMVTSYRRKGVLFDTTQLIPDSHDLLDYLGVSLELVKFEGYYARIFLANPQMKTCKEICIPSSIDGFKSMLLKQYSHESKGIELFFHRASKLMKELYILKLSPSFWQLCKCLFTARQTVKLSKKTFAQFMKECGCHDKELLDIFDVFAAFSGLPATRTSAIMTTAAMMTSLKGCYRPKGGFLTLPIQMRKRLEELGGEVQTNSTVEKIGVEDGKVTGVLVNEKWVNTKQVITTIDPKVAMNQLVGEELLNNLDPKYGNKVNDVKMSASSMSIQLGLDEKIDLKSLGLDCGYNVITTGKGTFETLFSAFDKNGFIRDDETFHLAVICPSLKTGEKPSICIRVVPMPMDDWKTLREKDYETYCLKKEEVAQFYIQKVEKYLIPHLTKHIAVKDIITPATFERFQGSPTGSNYDMAPYPDNFGLKRLKMKTPIEGLYQPKFSHGILPALLAGLQVVDLITGGKIMNGNARYQAPAE